MASIPEPPESDISAEFPYELHEVNVLGSKMAYVDTQPGVSNGRPTALFLHGNPTSSYLWRNVIPHLTPLMRCVAPDLIGMGHSSKPENLRYQFTDHHTYLSTFIETVIPTGPILLVIHDWGSGLGLHWAHQQAELANDLTPPRVAGLAMMEFIRPFQKWEHFATRDQIRDIFKSLRTPEVGRKMVIEDNFFVERLLPGGMKRKPSEAEMQYYRQPFTQPADRKPTYVWPNQIPIEQRPTDVYDIATRYHEWLLKTGVPIILFHATPGSFVPEEKAQYYKENLKRARVINVGEGIHYLQEDHPRRIGSEMHKWAVDELPGVKSHAAL